ncbi:hypothetical protein OG474_31775 [Kribbella sp. NBC_01505]|uniref:hypothetical protein n=1 Tax=Kribbella sp. NBC_01505 TaxID=2903580 RepID=UPI0038690D2C
MGKRRYVARGVPGGYRIWDNKQKRWWGNQYDFCPDALLAELNAAKDPAALTSLQNQYRAQKR